MLVTVKNFEEVMSFLQGKELLTCDTETNFCELQQDRYLIGIAILGVDETTGKERSFYFPYRHENDLKLNEDDVNLPEKLLLPVVDLVQTHKTIWHNGKFDLRQLAQEGLDADSIFYYDTLLLSFMENENKFSHELSSLGKLVGEKKLGKELDEIAKNLGNGDKAKGWVKIPPTVMGKYAEEDVLITWKLFKLFFSRVEKDEQLSLYPREVKIAHLIRRIEDIGVLIDRSEAEKLAAQTQLDLKELHRKLGFDPMKPSELAHRLYALPPEGLGFQPEAFSSRRSKEFAQGIPTMNEETLSRLEHPVVDDVLTYRGKLKALSTWYLGFLEKMGHDDRLHPDFKQHGTKTTRWSCANPNLHQLPRDTENTPVKKLLRATPNYQLWEFDYSQVEFRLGAVYAECYTILNTYRQGGDVHKITAQNIGAYRKFPQEPDQARYVGKQTNFLTIYGGGAKVLKKQLWRDAKIDLPQSECKIILDKFHKAYPEFRDIMAKVERSALRRGYIKLWNGRKRHFSEDYECRKAYNSLVQGGAAQIMIESMLELEKAGFRLVSQVHDSVWIEIPEDEVETQIPKIKEIMEWPSDSFDCPFPVDAKRLA